MHAKTEKAQIRVTQTSNGYWRIAFDNPPLNVMGPQFVREMREIVTAIEADAEVKVVVFESAVEGFFLNHSDFNADMKDLISMSQGPTGLEAWPDILVRVTQMPVVSIALIRGRATGNGSEIALACDMSFASREKTRLSQWEVGVGLVAGGGPMARLPRQRRSGRSLWLCKQVVSRRGTRWVRRRARYTYRVVRQMGDREHQAARERRLPAAERGDICRLGCLHGLDRPAGRAGQDQGVVRARFPSPRGRGRSPGVLCRAARPGELSARQGMRARIFTYAQCASGRI
jgi:hypothetical protein